MWDVVVDEQRQERQERRQQQQGGGANGKGLQRQQQGDTSGRNAQQGGPSGTAPQPEAEEVEVVVGSGLRCQCAGGVMTWVQSQQPGGAEAHGASVPDELAQNLDFEPVLGGTRLASGVVSYCQSVITVRPGHELPWFLTLPVASDLTSPVPTFSVPHFPPPTPPR